MVNWKPQFTYLAINSMVVIMVTSAFYSGINCKMFEIFNVTELS